MCCLHFAWQHMYGRGKPELRTGNLNSCDSLLSRLYNDQSYLKPPYNEFDGLDLVQFVVRRFADSRIRFLCDSLCTDCLSLTLQPNKMLMPYCSILYPATLRSS